MHLVPSCLTDTHTAVIVRGGAFQWAVSSLTFRSEVTGFVSSPRVWAREAQLIGGRGHSVVWRPRRGLSWQAASTWLPWLFQVCFWWDCNLQGCSWPWVCPWGQEGSGRPGQGPSNPHRALHLGQEGRARPAVSCPLVHILSKYSFKNLLRWKIEKFRVILFKYTQGEKEEDNKLSFPGFGSCPHLADHVSPIPPHPLYLLEFSKVLIRPRQHAVSSTINAASVTDEDFIFPM